MCSPRALIICSLVGALVTGAAAASAGDVWIARQIDSRLPDRPAVALGPDGRGVLAYADARGVWVRAIARDGRLGARRAVPGPAPIAGWATASIDGRGAVTVAWLTQARGITVVVASWRRGEPPAPGAPVSPSDSQAANLVLAARPGGGTIAAWSESRLPSAPDQLVATAVISPGRPVERTEALALAPDERPSQIYVGFDVAGRPSVAVKTVATLGAQPATLVTADSSAADQFILQAAPRRQPLDRTELDGLQVLTDAHGAQLAVWLTGPFNGARRVQIAQRPRGARFSLPRTLARGRRIQSAVAAIRPSGTVAVVWSPVQGRLTPLIARLRRHGRWGAPVDLTAPGRSAQHAELALDPLDRATVVWGSLHGIRARRWSAGRLGRVQTVSAPWRDRLCWEPALTIGPRGDALATFLCTRRGARPIHGLAHRGP
jgi:hypothetical protein